MAFGDAHKQDVTAALRARRDLGEEYDHAIAQGVVEAMSHEIDARVEQRLQETLGSVRLRTKQRGGGSLGIISLIVAIPISAIVGAEAHVVGLAIAWGGIVGVNIASAIKSRGVPVRKL